MRLKCYLRAWSLAVGSIFLSSQGLAASFGAGISPSKFELRAKAGQVLRDTVTVLNAGEDPAEFQFRTVDWRLNDTNGVDFVEGELLEGSCRPWVRLERRAVRIRPGGQKKYRFEVHVPEDAEPGLCRFAILIEPGDEVLSGVGEDGQIRFPVVGRYAVITYITIGDAKADIVYLGIGERFIDEQRLPTLKLHNQGNTYDRAFGQVVATDHAGRKVTLIASTFPVLPDRIEEIVLAPQSPAPGADPVVFEYPLQLKGKVEIGGSTINVDATFE
jgi:hypothetical protein